MIATAAPAPGPSAAEKKLDELSNHIKTLQKQQQRQQQHINATYAMAAYDDQPPGTSRPFQPSNWQGPNSQLDQLQRRLTYLGSVLRRYQNPRHSANRSYDRSYRGWNDEYSNEFRIHPFYNRRSMLAIEEPPNSNQGNA